MMLETYKVLSILHERIDYCMGLVHKADGGTINANIYAGKSFHAGIGGAVTLAAMRSPAQAACWA